MSYPAYSVLLSVSDSEKSKLLSMALDSMINQTIEPAEIVLILEGELTDDLNETVNQYLGKYPELLKVLPLPNGAGHGHALRQGVLACTTGFIACMDADGYSVPTRIEEEFDALLENKVDVVGSNINLFVDSMENVVARRLFPETPELIYKYAKKERPMSHTSILMKKRVVLASGNYESCNQTEDYALFIRLLSMCAKGYNIQKPLVFKPYDDEFYRQHTGLDYFKTMIMFNKRFYRTGWFSYRNYVVRSMKNGVESFMPCAVKKLFARRLFL